jgi:hypothetical protein
VWAVLLLIGYRGIVAIIDSRSPAPRAPAPATASTAPQFPVTMAEAYALQFGDVYLSFSPATAAQRSRELARYLPPGTDPNLGWNGAGSERVLDAQVAGVSITDRHSAVVTVLARLSGGRLVELGVPIYTARGAMVVSGDPALLPAPPRVSAPGAGQAADEATATELTNQLPAFFKAYASGDRTTLARFTWPGARISGLGGEVTFGSINNVYAPPGGARRQVLVTVTWELPAVAAGAGATPASLEMTYQLTVVRQQGSWDVQAIGASTTGLAQGPP